MSPFNSEMHLSKYILKSKTGSLHTICSDNLYNNRRNCKVVTYSDNSYVHVSCHQLNVCAFQTLWFILRPKMFPKFFSLANLF